MTAVHLKELCKKYNVKPGSKSNKDEVVRRLLARSITMNTNRAALSDLLAVLLQPALKDPAPLHNFYRAHFNLDDLTDRKWYAVEEHHPNHSWKSKFTLSILRFAVYDAWVFGTKAEYSCWKNWRMTLAQKLYKFDM